MLALDFADLWLAGRWLPGGYSPAPGPTSPGDVMQDIFGQAITVGSKVKLIGTVTAIDPMNTHFQDITFVPDYPLNPTIKNTTGVGPQQHAIASVKCHPLQLVKVGSSL